MKKSIIITAAVLAVGIGGCAAITLSATNEAMKAIPPAVTSIDASETTVIEEPGRTVDNTETLAQENAREKAKSYLNSSFLAFSRDGLISQLEFEGFSPEDAAYGVDAQGADWNEQACKQAKSYLDSSVLSFSRDGLIRQLEFGKFTSEQAQYGATCAGY